MLIKQLEEKSKMFKGLLMQELENRLTSFPNLKRQALYTISDVGVLFRPYLFCLGINNNSKRAERDYYDIAVAIELLQISTLIIDDIFDDSLIRNGRKSMPEKFGIKNTILVGELFKSITNETILENSLLPIENKFQIIRNLENAYHKICIGQFLDLQYEKVQSISEKKYLEMIEYTTGYFIQASLLSGAVVAGVNKDDHLLLADYGLKLGTAYQLRDDLVNIFANGVNGKMIAEDLVTKKKRLPVIFILNNKRINKEFFTIWNKTYFSKEDINRLVNMIKDYGSVDYCVDRLKKLSQEAITAIELSKLNIKQELIDLANLICSV